MDSKTVSEKSGFHKYIEGIVHSDFDGIKFGNDKSMIVAAMDETDQIYIFSRGSKENVTLAICELFHSISEMDSVYLCEMFAEMLSKDNAEYIFNAIKQRADFDSLKLE